MMQSELSRSEIERYSRHLVLPEVGFEGQKKLKQASVLIVGVGGLGSPAALYLAAAGVGRIGLVDDDVVEKSNLQRQILHGTSGLGRSKTESARQRLLDINPEIKVEVYDTLLTVENAREICAPWEIILDGTDNFATRYLVNDLCVLTNKTNVYGSIYRFDGQVSVFKTGEGPCYRCLYPQPPAPDQVPNCTEGGVLGVLPGIIGSMQANEVIKLVLGKGEPLIGRLLLFDALAMRFDEMHIAKDPVCPVCGKKPVIRDLIDYDEFCGIESSELPAGDDQIHVVDLQRMLQNSSRFQLLDVRAAAEQEICKIDGSIQIPLNQLSDRMSELDISVPLIVYCRSGIRSTIALRMLQRAGFEKVKNLAGGILEWAAKIDPSMPRY